MADALVCISESFFGQGTWCSGIAKLGGLANQRDSHLFTFTTVHLHVARHFTTSLENLTTRKSDHQDSRTLKNVVTVSWDAVNRKASRFPWMKHTELDVPESSDRP